MTVRIEDDRTRAVETGPTVPQLRHRAEVPMLALGVGLTAVVAIGAVGALLSGVQLAQWSIVVLGGLAAGAITAGLAELLGGALLIVGFAVPMSIPRYSCIESALTTTPP